VGSAKLSVLVPLYDEDATCVDVLRRVDAVPIEKEIVVDDGSRVSMAEQIRAAVPSARLFADPPRGPHGRQGAESAGRLADAPDVAALPTFAAGDRRGHRPVPRLAHAPRLGRQPGSERALACAVHPSGSLWQCGSNRPRTMGALCVPICMTAARTGCATVGTTVHLTAVAQRRSRAVATAEGIRPRWRR